MAQAQSPRHTGRRPKSPAERGPTWGERLRAMRNLPPFLAMVWRTHRGMVAAICVLRLLRAFVPVATLWIGKLVIDAVVTATRTGEPHWNRIITLGVFVALLGFGSLAMLFTLIRVLRVRIARHRSVRATTFPS